ncbi:MAG: glycoside hydrolase family 108 protein [Pseudomonadota bacterium]
MQSNFEKSLAYVLEHEGGYVNHPRDPGGATNKGVTQAVYDAYRKTRGRGQQPVKFISEAEVRAIYKFQYWDRVHGDLLPLGVDYAVFDFAVNSGVGRASKYLQAVLGVSQDGQIGALTLAAIANAARTINALCDRRMGFLRNLRTFLTFGKGWTRRVQGVRAHALEMAT